jgi:hypothetical protein
MTDRESAAPAPFAGLVAGLAASAAAMLQQVGSLLDGKPAPGGAAGEQGASEVASPEQRADAIRTALTNARHYIDTLVVLQQKTKGNLTQDEEQLLAAVLTDLKISFVKLNDRWTSTKNRE